MITATEFEALKWAIHTAETFAGFASPDQHKINADALRHLCFRLMQPEQLSITITPEMAHDWFSGRDVTLETTIRELACAHKERLAVQGPVCKGCQGDGRWDDHFCGRCGGSGREPGVVAQGA